MSKHSDNNLSVINNFILHLMHPGGHGLDSNYKLKQTFTAEELYKIATEYIEEDHVDGKDNPEVQ